MKNARENSNRSGEGSNRGRGNNWVRRGDYQKIGPQEGEKDNRFLF